MNDSILPQDDVKDVLLLSTATNDENGINKIVNRSSDSVSGDVFIGDVSQSYTHSPPIAGLCLGVSSASSGLAQPGLGLNPASPRKALGRRKRCRSATSSHPGRSMGISLAVCAVVSLSTPCEVSHDATASSLSVYSSELITVSRLNEISSGSSPDVPAQAAFLLLPLMLNATIGDVSQSYAHSPPIAGLCLGVSSASSKLAQPGLGLDPASPVKALGKRRHCRSATSSHPGRSMGISLAECAVIFTVYTL